jgi:sec-independent protein translocase protein TatA
MGISIWQLLIILAIVLVLFGAKRLRNLGSDLGTAIKGFKESVKSEEDKSADAQANQAPVIDVQASSSVDAKNGFDAQQQVKKDEQTKS